MLIGSDMKLNSPSSLVGQALTEILQHPERARDALRVLLHLVRERKHCHSQEGHCSPSSPETPSSLGMSGTMKSSTLMCSHSHLKKKIYMYLHPFSPAVM